MKKLLLALMLMVSVLPLFAQDADTRDEEEETVLSATDSTANTYAARVADLKEHYEGIIAERDAQLERHNNDEIRIYLCAVTGGIAFAALLIIYNTRSHRHQIQELTEEKREVEKERKRLEKELREANATADVKTKFINQITHEIRTPLNAINGFTQILCTNDMEIDKDELAGIGNMILNNTSQLAHILEDIIFISDVESNKLSDLTIETINISNFSQEIADVKSIELYNYNPLTGNEDPLPEDATMNTDEKAVKMVLAKLINNANKFGGEANVKISVSKKVVTFSVYDAGEGIPEEEKERIFDLFYKIDSFKPGAGLGLCVARSIAHRLGGEVTYAPKDGKSRFSFTILRRL